MLDHCIFAINAVDRENPLRLHSEYSIDEPALVVTGNATWAVTKGPYIVLVVNEVKHGGVYSSQHPLLATMEAARIINKQVPEPVHHIHAICTDLQNWLFVERKSRVLRQTMTGTSFFGDTFPDSLIPICELVYSILLEEATQG